MRRIVFAIALGVTLPLAASSIDPAISRSVTTRRHIFFSSAQRLIHLPDGSNLLIYQPDLPNGRPPEMRVFIVAPSGDADSDRSFTLEQLIPNEIAKDYPGQIRSAAMSDDHQWLAVVGGWLSSRDNRGHNGIFVLHLEGAGGFWRLRSWFDIADRALGDIAFAADDLLLVTSAPHRPAGTDVPIVSLFSTTGQDFGSFIPSANHSRALEMRLARTGNDTYALYDPETAQMRDLAIDGKVVAQQKSTPLPFSTDRVNVVAFDPLADGRIAFARTVVENHHAKTTVSIVRPDGTVAEEWIAPEAWMIGYADEQHVLHGYSHIPREGDMRMSITSVMLR